MEIFATIVEVANRIVWGLPEKLPWLVGLLLLVGLSVTLRMGFIQLRRLKHAVLVVLGRFDDPDDPGDVSHFQALSTALSATVGIGNIAGVATAIHYGGPGAVFWMWVTALFGMALKFAECTLAIRYRDFDDQGDAAGGPMYYIEKGLGPKWKPLAIFFAACAIVASFGGGNMNQANTVAVSAHSDFGLASWIVGGFLVVAVGAVILGGIRSIAKVASALAPTMAAIYVLGALTVLLMHVGEVPGAFGTIISNAFNPQAGVGGSAAGVFSLTLLWGVKRGLFSNEAGQGSAPIAHAAAKTNEPVREGAVAMLGPLIDTLIICTMTALVIVVTGVWDKKKEVRLELDSGNVSISLAGEQQAAEDGAIRFEVKEGLAEAVVFTVNDGPMDDVKIVKADSQPYSGLVELNAEGELTVNASLFVEGRALQNSSALTAWGFQQGLSKLGDWGNLVVTFCVFLFAISTMVSWSYYGDRCVTYLFGSKYVIFYRLVFLVFVYLGATTALETVWAYGDLALGLMTVPNLIAVVLLLPEVIKLTKDYFRRMDRDAEVAKAEVKSE